MAATDCLHSQLHGCCAAGEQCRVGRRFQHIYLLSGNLIHLWSRLERWFHRDTDSNHTAVTQDDLGSPPSTSAKQTPRFFVQPNRLEPSPFKSRLRLVRATLPNRQALIGALIPPQKLGVLKRNLKVSCLPFVLAVVGRGLDTASFSPDIDLCKTQQSSGVPFTQQRLTTFLTRFSFDNSFPARGKNSSPTTEQDLRTVIVYALCFRTTQ